jgi:hypothetical protein
MLLINLFTTLTLIFQLIIPTQARPIPPDPPRLINLTVETVDYTSTGSAAWTPGLRGTIENFQPGDTFRVAMTIVTEDDKSIFTSRYRVGAISQINSDGSFAVSLPIKKVGTWLRSIDGTVTLYRGNKMIESEDFHHSSYSAIKR